mgnify:CR=1 FL=1
MSPYLSKVKAALGATGARVAVKEHGVRRIVEHLGSAHNTAELAALLKAGWQKIVVEQDQTPGPGTGAEAHRPEQRCGGGQAPGSVRESHPLGLDETTGSDRAFEQMVLARLIELALCQIPAFLATRAWNRSASGP